MDVDYADRYSLIATRGEDGRSVGHSGYFRSSEGRAEIAFAVSDELQGRGLGTILLAHLAEVAIEHGIDTFEAEVLPENHRMIEVFRESGFPVEVRSVPGSIQSSSRPRSPRRRWSGSRTGIELPRLRRSTASSSHGRSPSSERHDSGRRWVGRSFTTSSMGASRASPIR